MLFSTLVLFLGILFIEYQKKNYYQALRCNKPHFIISIHKRVALIRIKSPEICYIPHFGGHLGFTKKPSQLEVHTHWILYLDDMD